ncbi:VanZ family protein [Agromyces sp. Marseille-Q5079]|uniref:VanZ family protein n=1 Tax=Agromyces sp. Marseille-Q5079 TaxID=3439059 RepID=UPI003D9C85E5
MSVDERMRPSARDGARSSGRARLLLSTSFGVYLALLFWIVLWKLELPYLGSGDLRQVKLVPFLSDACNGASAPSEVVANVLLFVPFGFLLGLLAPTWPWWRSVAVFANASLALEVAQYALAVGSSDVTDLVTNTVGGMLGLGLFALVRRRLDERTVPAMSRVCAVLTVLALAGTAVIVASPLNFGPQPDVMVSMQGTPHAAPGSAASARRIDGEAHEQRCR